MGAFPRPLDSRAPSPDKDSFPSRPDRLITNMFEDPLQVDSQHYSLEFENDHVRALRIRYAPGEKSVMHGHPPSVAIVLTDGRVRFSFPDGRVRERDVRAGDVHWNPAGEHQPENIGDAPLELVLLELKQAT